MTAAKSRKVALNPKIGVPDIRARWGKLDERELAAIKGRSDLVMQIQARYGLNKLQAETNVDVWANGRQF
jgi:hypothetical protein